MMTKDQAIKSISTLAGVSKAEAEKRYADEDRRIKNRMKRLRKKKKARR